MFFLIFSLSCISLALGSSFACLFKKTESNFILSLGFASGVMLYISLTESLIKTTNMLNDIYSIRKADLYTALLFFIGIFITTIIDKAFIKVNFNNQNNTIKNLDKIDFFKMFILVLLSAVLHNIPEDIYIVYRIKENIDVLSTLSITLILHNMMQGLAIGSILYYVLNDKTKTILYTYLFSLFIWLVAFVLYLFSIRNFDLHILSFLMTLSSALMLYVVFNDIFVFASKYITSYYILYNGLIIGIISMIAINTITPFLVKYTDIFTFIQWIKN